MKFRKPNECPNCGDSDIRFIVRGYPTKESMEKVGRNEAVLGGCFFKPGMPLWQCFKCKHEFSDPTDPAEIEFRKLEKKVLGKYMKNES